MLTVNLRSLHLHFIHFLRQFQNDLLDLKSFVFLKTFNQDHQLLTNI